MAASRASASAGFTLLELVVALALTSLVSLVAYTSLSLSIKAVTSSQAAADKLQEIRVTKAIIDRSLSSTVKGSVGAMPYFVGDGREMRFFTIVPLEAHLPGGVYHWRLLTGQDETGQGVLAVEQTKNVNWRRDPEGVEIRQILVGNLTAVEFAYGKGDKEFDAWDAKKQHNLPEWVRISLTQKGRPPMAWLIPIHVSEFKTQ